MSRLLLALLFLISLSLNAQSDKGKPAKAAKPIPPPVVFESIQSVTIAGKTTTLNTETGTHLLRDENDEPIAHFGYTSYEKQGGDKNRPIVFAFNGGPLSASFWLHMGIMGPKRIVVNDPGYTKAAPYEVVNNEFSSLDIADLVMIDPVGVGFSKPVGEAKWEDFWGVDQDVRAISLFIEQFLIKKGRFNAPKYLLGESYGTFRNAYLMKALQDKGIAMNGVIMVSAVFDLQHLLFGPGDDIAYLVHFPTYATTAWYHKKAKTTATSLEAFVEEVRNFTEDVYASALLKGDRLSADKKAAVAQQLADYTGVSQAYWLKANLRVTNREFFQELLREEGQVVGRLDSRFTGINQDLLAQVANNDPQSSAISPAYIAAFKNYLYTDLKADPNLTYTSSAGRRKGFKWDWKHRGNVTWNAQVAVSTAQDMATTLSRDPNMKVLILNGLYDIATVFYGVEHTVNHLNLAPEIKDNIIMKYYEAGHMMYTHEPSMIQFKRDVDAFIQETSRK
ncbi:MAG: S10 family peptidase [Saprospiraceae bacterium]